MNIENILYPIILIISAGASLWMLVNIKSFYNDPSRLPIKTPAWWPYSKKGWKIWQRATPIVVPLGLPFSIAGFLLEYGDASLPVVKILVLSLSFIVFFGVPLGILIAFIGRPKWLIPPHLR
jgi:hypothetical protein